VEGLISPTVSGSDACGGFGETAGERAQARPDLRPVFHPIWRVCVGDGRIAGREHMVLVGRSGTEGHRFEDDRGSGVDPLTLCEATSMNWTQSLLSMWEQLWGGDGPCVLGSALPRRVRRSVFFVD
jgi:hypothetical protein